MTGGNGAVVALLMSAALACGAGLSPIPLYILAGQSNLAGRGDAEKLAPELVEPYPAVRYFFQCSFGGAFESVAWVALEPCRKHPSTPGRHFGPELTFGRALGRPTAILKMGRGGSTLAEDWNPAATSVRGFYVQLLDLVRRAVAALDAPYELAGFVRLQGEADAANPARAAAYQANLVHFIEALRDLRAPSLRIAIAEIPAPPDGSAGIDLVRKAQRAAAQRDRLVRLVSASGLTTDDGKHWNGKSQVELGRRLAETFLDWDGR